MDEGASRSWRARPPLAVPRLACASQSLPCALPPHLASRCSPGSCLGLVLAQCGAEGRDVMGLRVDEVMCEEPKTCGSEEMAVDAMHVSGTRRRWAPAEALAVAPPARPASLGPVVHACPARVGPGWNAVCVL